MHGKMKYAVFLMVISFLSLPLMLRAAETQHDVLRKLEEGAKREGKVVWYGSMNLDEAIPFVKKFEQKYPFIKIDYMRSKGEVNANRVLAETRAGKNQFDLISGKLRALIFLKKMGLLEKYRSLEYKNYPESFRDPEGYWITQYLSTYCIGYNSRLVKPQDVPKSYEGLLDPKWKGKLAMDYYDYDWFTGLMEIMGRDKGLVYMQGLAKQEPIMRSGHTLLSQLLAAGEFSLSTMYLNSVARMKKINAPVDWIRFDFPAPTSLTSISMFDKAPHPFAAKLLYEFILSKEANDFLPTVGRISPRPDVPFPGIPKDFKFYPLSEALLTDVTDKNIKEYDRIFKKGPR